MKITKRQQRRLIREFSNRSYDMGLRDAESGQEPNQERYDNDPDYADGYDSYDPYDHLEENKTTKVTKHQLRRIIGELWKKDADGNLLPHQLSFNDTAVEEADSLLSLLDAFTSRYRKLTFEFPDTVDDNTMNDIENLILDAADKLRDIKHQMQDRGIK